jgi:Na+-transporting NADH:ubiquinone oxidoreductase subunit NqrB
VSASAVAEPRPRPQFRGIPVVLPSRHDPRLKLAAVIIALQVLGQAALGFKVSIAQILVTIGACAVVDTAVTWRRQRMLVWPASALLTGNSVAFILRATGTRHGDWWTLHGIQYFLLAAMLSLGSKYLLRIDDRHVFNPSNAGLVWVLLIIGPVHVFPQYLWWGPLDTGVVLALVVIAVGAVWILRTVKMVEMAASFWFTLAALIAVFALTGRSFFAIWHTGPIGGLAYWRNICLSPELLIFVFFMMSDPKTTPATRRGRVVYGALTAVLAAALLFWEPTEFGIKVAILASLTVSCALVPAINALTRPNRAPGSARSRRERALATIGSPAVLAAVVIAVAAPIDTIALRSNRQIGLLEQGLTGAKNPQ